MDAPRESVARERPAERAAPHARRADAYGEGGGERSDVGGVLQRLERRDFMKAVMSKDGTGDKSSAYQLHCGLFRLICTNGMVVSDGTFQRISIKHSGFNPDSVIEASFKVLSAVPDIMNRVQLFRERILTDAEQLALATGAAAYRWENLDKAR